MTTQLQIIFYSMYGHIFKMTEAIAEGVRQVKDVSVEIFRVPELVPSEILEKSGAAAAQKQFENIPILGLDKSTRI